MKRSLFLLPLGLALAASAACADPINIQLPPPTPLNPDAVTTPQAGQDTSLTKPVAQKKAPEYTDAELRAMGTGVAFPYELLDVVLHRYVSGKGQMYYLKAKDDNDLNTFARAVAIADLGQFPTFTMPKDPKDLTLGTYQDSSAELTFWINAYNGLRIKAIADLYPIPSILTVKDFETQKTQTVAGKKYSFTELRDKIGNMDPRALFAITNGTVDGPTVPLSVFRFSRLSGQLDLAVKSFVNDPNKVSTPDRLSNKVQASPYLKEVDPYFKKSNSSRRKFEGIRQVLGTYSASSVSQNYFITGEYTVDFTLANGKLNEQISPPVPLAG
ncbi:hypothetical protein IAD21_04110 [Abditibacteriota bacterium]|nr:hypothetical protein IAD21_04110 [Abditibacteriota bacterium]